jgi:hypothetical protein
MRTAGRHAHRCLPAGYFARQPSGPVSKLNSRAARFGRWHRRPTLATSFAHPFEPFTSRAVGKGRATRTATAIRTRAWLGAVGTLTILPQGNRSAINEPFVRRPPLNSKPLDATPLGDQGETGGLWIGARGCLSRSDGPNIFSWSSKT